MKIEDAILLILRKHVGKENAIRRMHLKWMLQTMGHRVSDRSMRQTIEHLRRTDDEGALICSSSAGGGYWIARNDYELMESYREERRRALNILVTIRERKERGRRALEKVEQRLLF